MHTRWRRRGGFRERFSPLADASPHPPPPPPHYSARMDGTRVICISSVVGKTVGSCRALFITFYALLRPSPSAWHLPGHMYLYTRTRLSEAAAAAADSYRLPTRVRSPFPSSRPVPTPPPDGDHSNSGRIKRATDCRPSFSRYRPTAAVIINLDQSQ